MQVSEQTLKDLEFPVILEKISALAFHQDTSDRILKLTPYDNKDYLIQDLLTTNEYLSGFQSENQIPFSEFHRMKEYLPLLEIENYYFNFESFFQIKSNALQIK
jgi:DNA mismatch repair protein MutS2